MQDERLMIWSSEEEARKNTNWPQENCVTNTYINYRSTATSPAEHDSAYLWLWLEDGVFEANLSCSDTLSPKSTSTDYTHI